MNIQILDSWLREHLKTDAKPKDIAEKLSLTSVSIERVEKYGDDYLYDIEVTTNRADLASVVGLAREAAAVLPQFGIHAELVPPELEKSHIPDEKLPLTVENDPKLVNRVLAVVMDVRVKESPKHIKERLEAAGIRSLNNLIDVTNYVMRTIGHPTHVFDYDRINPKKIVIRESKTGEKIVTLDEKSFLLPGGDIIADNGEGQVIDLLGIMGLENSVVTDRTKRVIFFIDNNDPGRMRKTSMSLGIRSEAVQLNEKGVDPELAHDALLYGIKLYEEIAEGKIASDIIDIYPNKPQERSITVSEEKINTVIGIPVPLKQSAEILEKLGFTVETTGKKLHVRVPTRRTHEVMIPEDLIEEIARVYGYHNIPSILPPATSSQMIPLDEDEYFWEKRVKDALKYWGFTEVYTYSMVAENIFEGPLDEAVTIKNPLSEEWVYMRVSLVPSLLQVIAENKKRKNIMIFELSNVYEKTAAGLPNEIRHLAGIIKKPKASFFEVKGIIEQLANDLGIKTLTFTALDQGSREVAVKIGNEKVGEVEMLDDNLIDFELDFAQIIKHATLKKTYKPLPKYPPIIEDISFIIDEAVPTANVLETIQKTDKLIAQASLLDRYKDSRTFHILYQHSEKNLTNEEVAEVREKIIKAVKDKHGAKLKS